MLRTVTRFRGEIRSVKMSTRGAVPVDLDPRYSATIRVASAPPDDKALQAGQTHVFGIHSPSPTFGDDVVGKTLDLEVQWNACNGKFRRFEELRTVPPVRWVEKYDGRIEVGHSYRAEVQWENDILRLVKWLHAPHHHSIGASFRNIDSFPELRKAEVNHTIVFEVLEQEIEYLQEWQWLNLYRLQIIEVLPDS